MALTAGQWDLALQHLHRAAAEAKDLEDRALADPEQLGEALASWAVNDTVRAYQGEGFERVYVHCGLAMAYLALGLRDDVYVEARLANRLLEAEEKLYDTTYQAGGWGHMLSAVAYELLGQPGEAYIDYERMVQKGVGTPLAGRALVRLSKELGRSDDLARWEQAFGPDSERPLGAANVIVLAGVGLGPYKVETRIPIPTGSGIVPVSGAGYEARPQPVSGVVLHAHETGIALQTTVVESVTQVAIKNLEDRMLWTLGKSMARGFLKREFTQFLDRTYGSWGALAGNLYAIMSERADLRAWLTLPDTWQAGRLFVPPGVNTFSLEALGGDRVEVGSFELEPGETMLIFVRTLDQRLYAHSIGGALLEPAEVAIPAGEEADLDALLGVER